MRPSATGVARSVVVCVRVCVRPAKVDEPIDNQDSICLLGTDSCGPIGVHFGATWRIRLNGPCAAAMRSRVKLLCVFGIIIINRFCYV